MSQMSSAEPKQFPSSHGLVGVPRHSRLEGKALKSHTCFSGRFKIGKQNIQSGQKMGAEMFRVAGGTPAPDELVQK